ncbi:MAG: hypothetical protein ACFE9R_06830, partial [Candidatus Hermodarchaeota archaeon]
QLGLEKGWNTNSIFAKSPLDAAIKSMKITQAFSQANQNPEYERLIEDAVNHATDLYDKGKFSECTNYVSSKRIGIGFSKELETISAKAFYQEGMVGQALVRCIKALDVNSNYGPALKLKETILAISDEDVHKLVLKDLLNRAKENNLPVIESEMEEKALKHANAQMAMVREIRKNPLVARDPLFPMKFIRMMNE